jgi:phosphotriesterase-related protein
MAFARTLRGDVAPETLGVVNSHDHLIRVGAGEVYIDPDHQLDSVEKAVEEATYFAEASKNWSSYGGTVVDMCPANCGRDVTRLAKVEEQVDGLQVILCTGFHQQKVYLETQSHWVSRYTVNQIADLIIADIVEGIDDHDYSGPIVSRTPYKAGVIKVATAYGKITAFERKCIEASCIAAIETGAPINTHTSAGTCGLEQAELMISLGVPADQIAIGHIQRNADIWYLTQILKTGVYLELDGTARLKYQPEENRIREFRELGKAGYGQRLLLGTDSGKRSYQKAYGSTTGVDYNPAVDGPRMIDEGFERAYVEQLLMYNAQTFFTMRKDA